MAGSGPLKIPLTIFLNHPLSADYNERIESCTKFLRENENLKSDKVQTLKNLDGKTLKGLETLDFDKEFKRRQNEYLKFVTEDNSLIKAAPNFEATIFLDE